MTSQFIFYCDYAGSRYEVLDSLIVQPKKENQTAQLIEQCKEIDLKLTRLCSLINKYFGLMLLLNVTTDCMIIIVDIYWIYGGLLYGDNPNFLREFNEYRHFNQNITCSSFIHRIVDQTLLETPHTSHPYCVVWKHSVEARADDFENLQTQCRL